MSTARRRGNREGSNPVRRADGRWQINLAYTDPAGALKRVTVYGKTADEARDKAVAVRARLRAHLPAKDRKDTVASFTAAWIASSLAASDRKATTKALYATLATKHIIGSTLGGRTLDALRPSHVEAWTVELRGRGLSPSSVRSTYTVLRAVLDTAVRDEAILRNPAAAIARPSVPKSEAAYLLPHQVTALLLAAGTGRYRPVFELLVNTGMRRGEALALRWGDVDHTARIIRVRGTLSRIDGALVITPPKTAKSNRVIHMSDTAQRILKSVEIEQKRERLRAGSVWVNSGHVFTTEHGAPCDPRNALRALKVAASKANLGNVGLHTLRHSAASVMLSNGVPLKVVSEILGHSSIAITGDVYGHVSPDVAAQALDSLSAALEG